MDNESTMFWVKIGITILVIFVFIPIIVGRFLTTVEAGTIRIVSWFKGVRVYKGPCRAFEIPLFTTATTLPSKAINIDLDISDQTADMDSTGRPRPIKVRVLASAIVSVGDSNEMIRTAANRFFAKPPPEQTNILTDLLTSTGRRAINLLHHDELFNARTLYSSDNTAQPQANLVPITAAALANDEEDRLAIIIKSACSRELEDLGLVFNSLNIKEVQSEVAEARRRQSAVEAKANADIVQADQERRSREAQLGAEQAVNDKQRELETRRAENSAAIATAEAKRQEALGIQREAELRATQLAQANADALRVKVSALAQAESEAIRIRKIGEAQADAIRLINAAIAEGGNAYIQLRQIEMLPELVPHIAEALSQAKMINISSDGSAATGTANQIHQVIQTLIAAQLVQGNVSPDGILGRRNPEPRSAPAPAAPSADKANSGSTYSAPAPKPEILKKSPLPPIVMPKRPDGDGS